MQILNIPVSPDLLEAWRTYLAPQRQPFFLSGADAARLGWPSVARAEAGLTAEEGDTLTTWRIPQAVDRVVWCSQAEWEALAGSLRRELLRLQVRHGRGNVPIGRRYADLLPDLPAGRFLWRRSQLTPAVLARLISSEGQACQRSQVPAGVWASARPLLPRVRELSGTFPQGSAGNCFGAVMGAAGVEGAEKTWMQREPFEAFLKERAKPGGRDDQPGTLLVWRSREGLAEHVAVALGGGWAFHKPSQTWWTPRTVLPLRELVRGWRTPGQRLGRYRLLPP